MYGNWDHYRPTTDPYMFKDWGKPFLCIITQSRKDIGSCFPIPDLCQHNIVAPGTTVNSVPSEKHRTLRSNSTLLPTVQTNLGFSTAPAPGQVDLHKKFVNN